MWELEVWISNLMNCQLGLPWALWFYVPSWSYFFYGVPVWGSVTVMSSITKGTYGRKGFSRLMVAVYHEGESRQELKAGVWRQVLRQRLWKRAAFNLSLHILCRVLSYCTEGHLPRGGITY